MELLEELEAKARQAQKASQELAALPARTKNKALLAMADALEKNSAFILAENEKDLVAGRKKGLTRALLDRLMLNDDRIKSMAEGIRQTAGLPDPIGEGIESFVRPNGLEIHKIRVPLGVIGIIYESRPNVTADAAALCLKSGNAVILRGGSEAICSNKAVARVLTEAAYQNGIPEGAVAFIDQTDRQAVGFLLEMDRYIDLIIPRGGAGLIKTVVKNSKVPVIETGAGICHTFIDESADLKMAAAIAFNAKVSRPAVCNSMETLLVHEKIAAVFLPGMLEKLRAADVEIRGCGKTRAVVPGVNAADEADWALEYDDLILSVKVVQDVAEAIAHINRYNTKHSETIVTNDYDNARLFQKRVDAAVVYVNASTRFTDGFEFGFGAEIGISTQKMHARGPMGLRELTSVKYLVFGEGQTR